MMFITLALVLILVALIVLALKKHQQRRLDDLAERDHSLPPLDLDPQTPTALEHPEPQPPAPDTDTDTDAVEGAPKYWKEECKALRQAQQFDRALTCADQAWPQSQSYEQAAVTIRAAIKQARSDNSPDIESWLTALYRAAAEFSVLYDKVPGEPELRWQTVARTYTREELGSLSLPWSDIGVNELKLLTKTDRKLMIQVWGEPRQHVSAKAWLREKSQS